MDTQNKKIAYVVRIEKLQRYLAFLVLPSFPLFFYLSLEMSIPLLGPLNQIIMWILFVQLTVFIPILFSCPRCGEYCLVQYLDEVTFKVRLSHAPSRCPTCGEDLYKY